MTVYKIDPNPETMHFITLTTVDWVDIFTKAIYFEILINSLKFCQKEKGLIIHAYVLMTNHSHMIVSCNPIPLGGSKKMLGGSFASDLRQSLENNGCSEAQLPRNIPVSLGGSCASDQRKKQKPRLSQILQDFKRHTATQIFKELQEDNRNYIQEILMNQKSNKNEKFQLWQHDNHPIVIESDKFFQQKLTYIHNNPVKQQYVEAPEHWLYSSARNYYFNDHSVIEVDLIS